MAFLPSSSAMYLPICLAEDALTFATAVSKKSGLAATSVREKKLGKRKILLKEPEGDPKGTQSHNAKIPLLSRSTFTLNIIVPR